MRSVADLRPPWKSLAPGVRSMTCCNTPALCWGWRFWRCDIGDGFVGLPTGLPSHLQMGVRSEAWITTSLLAGAAGIAIVFAYFVSRGSPCELSLFVKTSAIIFMSLACVGALAFSLWWQWRSRVSSARPATPLA